MHFSADRLSGAFFLLFGLAMNFLIIPGQVETTDGGNLAPKTVPIYICVIITICGALLVLKPTERWSPDPRTFFLAGAYAAVLAAGIYAMSWFGFEYVAPVLAFAIMWMIGERRPFWLIGGAVLIPLLIWFLVTYPLGRALP